MLGLERLHPFDARKFSRAWALLRERLGPALDRYWAEPDGPAPDTELRRVHGAEYLESLQRSAVVAEILELGALRLLPSAVLERGLLTPMRIAVAGTTLAAARALAGETIAMNLGGGFHHAFADHGEGFCVYADVAIAIAAQRAAGTLAATDVVGVIDLDAHRGNGFWSFAKEDPAIGVLDVYIFQRYPGPFDGDAEAFPFQVPLRAGVRDADYLATVAEVLPPFLASLGRPRLVVYNAGTDIVDADPIGGLAVSPEGVLRRDQMVISTLAERRIPTLIVTSGGYTERSHALIAQLALLVIATQAEEVSRV
jgi:histone deacetylase 11